MTGDRRMFRRLAVVGLPIVATIAAPWTNAFAAESASPPARHCCSRAWVYQGSTTP